MALRGSSLLVWVLSFAALVSANLEPIVIKVSFNSWFWDYTDKH